MTGPPSSQEPTDILSDMKVSDSFLHRLVDDASHWVEFVKEKYGKESVDHSLRVRRPEDRWFG